MTETLKVSDQLPSGIVSDKFNEPGIHFFRRRKLFLLIGAAVALGLVPNLWPVEAQLPAACAITGNLSMDKLRACQDTIEWRRKQDSARFALLENQSRQSFADLYAKLQAHEDRLNAGGAGTGGGTVNGNLTVTGDLTVLGYSSFNGPMKPGVQSAIQLHGRGAAEIIAFSNEEGLDVQNPPKVHCGVWSLGNDGGQRMFPGAYWGPDGMVWCDSTRPLSILGFDSMGTLSLDQAWQGIPHDSAQLIIWSPDWKNKVMRMTLTSAGWRWQLVESTGVNTLDRIVFPPP